MAEITPEDQYLRVREDLLNRNLSNAENYDRAILSLSTASLGFSLAFLRDPVRCINGSEYLMWSWRLFIGAIVVTLASFLVSQRAIKRHLRIARRVYIDKHPSAAKEPNPAARLVNWMAYGAGGLFVLAICLTAHFASLNTGEECMANKQPFPTGRTERPSTGDRTGQPVTTNRPAEAPMKKGAPIPELEPIMTPQKPSPATPPATNQPGPKTTAPDQEPQAKSVRRVPTSEEIMVERHRRIYKEAVRRAMHPDKPSDPDYV